MKYFEFNVKCQVTGWKVSWHRPVFAFLVYVKYTLWNIFSCLVPEIFSPPPGLYLYYEAVVLPLPRCMSFADGRADLQIPVGGGHE